MTYITVDIDIDNALQQVSDEDIKEEYLERFGEASVEVEEFMQRVQLLFLNGHERAAYEQLYEYMLDKLNRIV
jgi:hypothetical protein